LRILLVLLFGLSAAPLARAQAPADGFDHIAHHGVVQSKAIAPPPCARCHRTDARGALVGKPNHASCFGDCHGKPPARPYKMQPGQEPVCRVCHPQAQLARLGRGPVRSAFPPYGPDGEFAVTMSHAAHRAVNGGCRACHAQPPEPDQPARKQAGGHGRCSGCHARGNRVAMSACASCHTPAVGPVRAPRAEPGPFPVGRRFSHRKHMVRAGRAGCASCHSAAAAATGDAIATPKKEQCAGCHDGKKAFSMVEPSCRRCHAAPDREEPAPDRRRPARFSHAVHDSECRACHEIDARGMAGSIGRGHRPCSDAGCHAADFASRQPETCTVCHARAEPWRDLHVDPQPADAAEFGARFSHKGHGASDATCASCHPARPSGRFGQVSGHDTCSGKGCHLASAGARPPLGECAGCHQRGLTRDHARSRRARRWSVRARFSHQGHRNEPAEPTRALSCTGCHTGVAEATSLADLAPPAKPTCARCHDGTTAFKLTGHACSRCHVSGGAR
jgi:c(7)-type cytochrome triheme protein